MPERVPVRVRFCPSPTGTPHVGLVRTALFNWAFARHHGGTFVFRIEDTDASRDSEESYKAILDALRWLGLHWDEGPEVGGPHAPYRQSQRRDLYRDVLAKLVESGEAYESFSTAEEVAARHLAAGRDPKLGYDNFDRTLDEADRKRLKSQGRAPVIRLKMPDRDHEWEDLVRGRISYPAVSQSDYVLSRVSGDPLYTLVNPVDDALMGITHVLRGEDLLSSTPRQLALHEALGRIGASEGKPPEFGHMPYVMGDKNTKLSKRDPESSLFHHRDRGFVPEGLLNYLALLGWGIGEDRDVFSLQEMVAAFDVHDVKSSPARFDQKKADAINAAHLRQLAPEDFAERLWSYLVAQGRLSGSEDRALFGVAAELVQTRVQVLGEAWDLLKFLYTPESDFRLDPQSAAKELGSGALPVLEAVLGVLDPAVGEPPAWSHEALEAALHSALIDGLGLKPRAAFGPIRVAVTGARISPPLFESMELLGRDRTIHRLRSAHRDILGQ
ncbi:glutamyl-tRNA synthetase [Segniliparus rotundus DSM 44985]|uniref:Glutamate--tRNA ligase n=1 Tax=Segniliparus rotundus (strain ATCC BAA-972 / CDC 1076 / CIP 108378 / DSM 44985 / JCM 13578) TaxID=640132 RepID=D6Z990_SEGRD|nr:glutamate--tRNA ligase [Segniliparus rotundus]ADG98520.1 glutamyl-tRNA synthetase [Segniliparus rotundus DSM 44985]